MLVVKNRNKSNYLCAMEALDKRMALPNDEISHYSFPKEKPL